jgi:hypothetical protein
MDSRALALANRAAMQFVAVGRPELASDLLAGQLALHDPAAASPDDEDLLQAAYLWCGSTPGNGETVDWARYLHTAHLQRHGHLHDQTQDAAELLAEALLTCDDPEAIEIRQTLLIALAVAPADPNRRIIPLRKNLARTLHHFGHCGEAIRQAQQAWLEAHEHQQRRYLLKVGPPLIAMLTACDRTPEAELVRIQLNAAADPDDKRLRLEQLLLPHLCRDLRRAHKRRCARHLDLMVDGSTART